MRVRPALRPGAGRAPVGFLAIAALALLAGAMVAWPRTVDDSYITYRYSENLAEGRGAVFNPGERVEGYSSPSWMLVLAGAIAAKLDPERVSKLLGVACSLLLLWAVYRALRRAGVSDRDAALAAIPLGASYVLQLWSVAGLETNAYALQFFAGLVILAAGEPGPGAALAASAALAGAALTRPEGIAFWGLGLVAGMFSRRSDRWRALALYALPGLAIAAHFAWRLRYYGAPFPNTYYAKAGGGPAMWTQGLLELRGFSIQGAHAAWILAAAWGALVAFRMPVQRRRVAVLAGAAGLHALYVVSVGGDGLFIHRFFVPVLPLIATLAGLLFLAPGNRLPIPPARRATALAAFAFTAVASAWTLSQWAGGTARRVNLSYQEGNVRLGRALAAMEHPPALVAVAAAGAIPYYSRLPVVDMYGLNDAHIAHGPFPESGRERIMKWDNAYVIARAPGVIVINRGYFRAGDPRGDAPAKDAGFMAVSAMDRDLFRRVAASGRYALSRVPFPDGSSYWVFARAEAAPTGGNR